MRICERSGGIVGGLQVGESIAQHVSEARGLLALAVCRVGSRVFCFFGEEMQKDFVVGEEGGLGGFDLSRYVCEWESEFPWREENVEVVVNVISFFFLLFFTPFTLGLPVIYLHAWL